MPDEIEKAYEAGKYRGQVDTQLKSMQKSIDDLWVVVRSIHDRLDNRPKQISVKAASVWGGVIISILEAIRRLW